MTSVGIETTPWIGRDEMCGQIYGRDKRFVPPALRHTQTIIQLVMEAASQGVGQAGGCN